MKNWIYLLCASIAIISCRTRNTAHANPNDRDSIQVINSDKNIIPADAKAIHDRLSFYENVYIHSKFDHVKINSKIISDDIRVSPLDATIYIETNKKIWANISFLIIPAARALITPEGIKAVDKYNKNYIDSDFEYLNNLLGTNIINYENLEKILLGRTFLTLSNRNSSITESKKGYHIATIANKQIEVKDEIKEYKVNMDYSKDYELVHVRLEEVNSREILEIFYENWAQFENNVRLPKNVKIIIKGSKNSQILLENTKFDFAKMETPYSVPANYKKIEIK